MDSIIALIPTVGVSVLFFFVLFFVFFVLFVVEFIGEKASVPNRTDVLLQRTIQGSRV